MVNREELRKLIPKGYCKKIAELADVSTVSVSRYFAEKFNSERIENAALQIASEIQKEKIQLINAVYES